MAARPRRGASAPAAALAALPLLWLGCVSVGLLLLPLPRWSSGAFLGSSAGAARLRQPARGPSRFVGLCARRKSRAPAALEDASLPAAGAAAGGALDLSAVPTEQLLAEMARRLDVGAKFKVQEAELTNKDPNQVYTGTVKSYNATKGFGFIVCPETHAQFGSDVFIHKDQVEGINVDDTVKFTLRFSLNGQPQAKDVDKAELVQRMDLVGEGTKKPAPSAVAPASSISALPAPVPVPSAGAVTELAKQKQAGGVPGRREQRGEGNKKIVTSASAPLLPASQPYAAAVSGATELGAPAAATSAGAATELAAPAAMQRQAKPQKEAKTIKQVELRNRRPDEDAANLKAPSRSESSAEAETKRAARAELATARAGAEPAQVASKWFVEPPKGGQFELDFDLWGTGRGGSQNGQKANIKAETKGEEEEEREEEDEPQEYVQITARETLALLELAQLMGQRGQLAIVKAADYSAAPKLFKDVDEALELMELVRVETDEPSGSSCLKMAELVARMTSATVVECWSREFLLYRPSEAERIDLDALSQKSKEARVR